MEQLADNYCEGKNGFHISYHKALKLYESAVRKGSIYSVEKLAESYREGIFTEQNPELADKYQELAEQYADSRKQGEIV